MEWDGIGSDWTLFDIRAGICWKMLYLITGVVYKVRIVSGVFVMSRDGSDNKTQPFIAQKETIAQSSLSSPHS